MVTSRKKSEFVLTSTSTGVIIKEKYDFQKYANSPCWAWMELPDSQESKEIGKMIVHSLLDIGKPYEALSLCLCMMRSVIRERSIVDSDFFDWARKMGSQISWYDDYTMECYDDNMYIISEILDWC